ncbi:hypothetical protein TNCV_4148661 [Trichonephila clavipes]|nr:hypothetical protein TNCV_4148661 [Trichonephila clavipes]
MEPGRLKRRARESRFNLSSDDNRVCSFVETRGERLNPAIALQPHTAPTDGVMVWSVIVCNTRSSLVLILTPWQSSGMSMTYATTCVAIHATAPRSHFSARQCSAFTLQGCHKTVSALVLPFLSLPDLYACLHLRISRIIWDGQWASYEFE